MKQKLYIILAVTALTFNACTKGFEEANTNPYEVSTESLKQDFNYIGAFFPNILSHVLVNSAGQQVTQNLCSDSWACYMGTPTAFEGGVNNTTYHMVWEDSMWGEVYENVMPQSRQVIQLADEGGYKVFSDWAKLIRIMSVSMLTTYHGPVIYSAYGSAVANVEYDSEEKLYNTFFTELDAILATFNANQAYAGLQKFDATYNGNVKQWIKVVNSLRLRLAVRISKVKPDLAKAQAEKAFNDPGGLIMTNADNLNISLYGQVHPMVDVCFNWGDTRMSAAMESILVGYKDNRIEKFFNKVTDSDVAALCSDHPDKPFKGIQNGALLGAKDDRVPFSTVNESFKTATYQTYIQAAEVYFLLAEGKLRNWAVGSKTAEEYYAAGVKASFEKWGAGGADAYLADDTSLPLNYTDPKAPAGVNAFVSRITSTVKWHEADTPEQKLEKIITQKWIAGFPSSFEAWADFRRTGYPKLPYVYKNDSYANDGIIAKNDFIKRMRFIPNERVNNPQGVGNAINTLSNKKDEIGTRLWWDTGTPNF